MLRKLYILLPAHDQFKFYFLTFCVFSVSVVIYLLSFFILFIWILSPFLLMSLARGLLILFTLSENPVLILQVYILGLSRIIFLPPECFQSEVVCILGCRNHGFGGPALFLNFCFLSSWVLIETYVLQLLIWENSSFFPWYCTVDSAFRNNADPNCVSSFNVACFVMVQTRRKRN